MKKELFTVFDFPGLVRAIANFNGLNENCIRVDFDFEELSYAKVNNLWHVKGSLTNLVELDGLELLFTAAHEIGHIVNGDVDFSFLGRIKRKIVGTPSEEEKEKQADIFACKYSTSSGATYRECKMVWG